MVRLYYGHEIVEIAKDTKFLDYDDRVSLTSGFFGLKTGIPNHVNVKIRRIYYVGVLYEIFEANFPDTPKTEIYDMMIDSFPLFIKPRQLQNILAEYFILKKEKDVFTTTWE